MHLKLLYIGLCHAGRWKSVTTANEYVENTGVMKADRASRLDGSEVLEGQDLPAQKRSKLGHSSSEAPIHHGDTYIINITGETGGGHFHFLNGTNALSGGLSAKPSTLAIKHGAA